jgi:hypothetical protein
MTGDDFVGSCPVGGSALPDALVLLAPALTPGGPPWPHTVLGRNPELRVAVVHGSADRVSRPSRGERTAEVLRGAGYDATFELVAGDHYDLVMVGGVPRPPVPAVDGPVPSAAERAVEVILDSVP